MPKIQKGLKLFSNNHSFENSELVIIVMIKTFFCTFLQDIYRGEQNHLFHLLVKKTKTETILTCQTINFFLMLRINALFNE